jgi:cytochrome c-type biogenesis protein
MPSADRFKTYLLAITFGLFAVIVFGVIMTMVSDVLPAELAGGASGGLSGNIGWYLFAFVTGLTMIVLPCTLPLAFVIVPLSMGKGLRKGVGIALSFGLGVATMLSIYGVVFATIGLFAIGPVDASIQDQVARFEVIKNWVYFLAGIFAYLFALGEIGLLKVRMPSYSGSAPAFIQKQGDFLKAFLLGLFLGNVGVGCPHPATPLLLIEITTSADVAYGWTLFLTHALGRVLPLLVLAFLAILGVNGLQWLLTKKDKIEHATGVAMVFVAAFILVLGLFSHDWWVNSGIHTQLEKVTQESYLLGMVRDNLKSTVTHSHGIEDGTGLFGLPLWLGTPVMVALWLIPLWWMWLKRRHDIDSIPESNQVPEKQAALKTHLANEKGLTALSLILILVFIYFLPHQFLKHTALEDHHGGAAATTDHAHPGMTGEQLATHTAIETAAGVVNGHAHPGMTTEQMQAHMATENAAAQGTMQHVMPDGTVMAMPMNGGMMTHNHTSTYLEEEEVTAGIVVTMEIAQDEEGVLRSGVPTTITFRVTDKTTGEIIDTLDLNHEKYLHNLGIRSDLNEFFHVHADKVEEGVWQVEHTFAKGGQYKLYTDVMYRGVAYTFGHKNFTIEGANDSGSIPFDFSKNKVLGSYQVGLETADPIIAGKPTTVTFVLKNVYGVSLPLANYLGAQMHLAGFKSGNQSIYIHTHPDAMPMTQSRSTAPVAWRLIPEAHAHGGVADGHADPSAASGTRVSFTVTFPEPGTYKLIGQFRPFDMVIKKDDEAMHAAFYVPVYEPGKAPVISPTPVSSPLSQASTPRIPQLLLVIVSLILMAGLSFGVWKYLQRP